MRQILSKSVACQMSCLRPPILQDHTPPTPSMSTLICWYVEEVVRLAFSVSCRCFLAHNPFMLVREKYNEDLNE